MALKCGIVGLPNVGKSTLINTLAGRSIANVGDKPAITKNIQKIDLKNGILISDTPGLLYPEITDENIYYKLAASGSIADSAMDYVAVGVYTASYFIKEYPDLLSKRYDIENIPEEPYELLAQIGKRLGCVIAGAEIDLNRTSESFLRDIRSGKLGRVSFEKTL